MSFTVHSDDLAQMSKILKQFGDGKELRRELAKNLRKASEPARDAARANILEMDSGGMPHDGEPLRQAIASRIVTEARLSGRSTGARVKVKRKGMPRSFEHAAKRTNRTQWRHRVYGMDVWVEQVGRPRWFDDAMIANKSEWKQAVVEAMEITARKIATRSNRGA